MNSNRRRRSDRHHDRMDEMREEQNWDNRQGYDSNEWERRNSGYDRDASGSGYGSSMSSQGGGAYNPDNDGYRNDSNYTGQRRYNDSYYQHNNNRYNNESRRFDEERGYYSHPPYGQSYESANGYEGYGNHMGYGEKGARYRDEFNGRYGAREEQDQQDMGSSSYFVNTNSDAYRQDDDHWNIGNYGERNDNERGYGNDDRRRDRGRNRNRNTQNNTW